MDAVYVPAAAFAVGAQGGQGQQRRLRGPVGQLYLGLGQVLVALHHVQVHGVSGGLLPVPGVGAVQVPGVQGDAAQGRVYIGQEPAVALVQKPGPESLQGPAGIPRLAGGQIVPGQKPRGGKLDIRSAVLLDLAHAGHQGKHPAADVLALFKFALGNGAVPQADPVLPQDRFHGNADGLVEQVVPLAPGGEVLAAVHNAGQGAGNGEGGQIDLLVGHQPEHRRDGLCQVVHLPLGQGDIQPGQAAPGLLPRRVVGVALPGEGL